MIVRQIENRINDLLDNEEMVSHHRVENGDGVLNIKKINFD